MGTKYDTFCLDNNFYNYKYKYNDDSESIILAFLMFTAFFMYKFSNNFFNKKINLIKPLECTYKYLFNYSINDDDNIDYLNENNNNSNNTEELTNIDISHDIDTSDNTTEIDIIERDNETNLELDNDTSNNTTEIDIIETDNETKLELDNDTNDFSKYIEIFKEHDFKMFLLNFLKNKEKEFNSNKLDKYKKLIDNLEKDIYDYVYI